MDKDNLNNREYFYIKMNQETRKAGKNMINIIKQNDNIASYIVEYIADTEEDIKDLPKNSFPGSTCIVAETGNVYILNSKKEWIKL